MSQQDKPSMDDSGKSKADKEGNNADQRQNVDLNEKPEADTQSEFAKAEELRNRE